MLCEDLCISAVFQEGIVSVVLIENVQGDHKDYSRKTGRFPWGRHALNETGVLTYILKGYPLEVVEQAIRPFP